MRPSTAANVQQNFYGQVCNIQQFPVNYKTNKHKEKNLHHSLEKVVLIAELIEQVHTQMHFKMKSCTILLLYDRPPMLFLN